MGRKKLNRTDDEIREMRRCRDKRYYSNNLTKVKESKLRRYHEKKINTLQDNKS